MRHERISPFKKASKLTETGLMMMEDDNYVGAVECFDEALKNAAGPMNFKGRALIELEEYDRAVECQEMALAMHPGNLSIMIDKGIALNMAGRYEEAIAVLDEVLAKDGERPQAWFNKACALALLEKDEEAFECVKKSYRIDPENTSYFLDRDEAFDRIRKSPMFEKLRSELTGRMSARQDLAYIR